MIVLGGILILISFLIPLIQVCLWLYHGHWTSVSVGTLTSHIVPNTYFTWLADDTSWSGLKSICQYLTIDMSLFGFLFWLGAILILLDRDKLGGAPTHAAHLKEETLLL